MTAWDPGGVTPPVLTGLSRFRLPAALGLDAITMTFNHSSLRWHRHLIAELEGPSLISPILATGGAPGKRGARAIHCLRIAVGAASCLMVTGPGRESGSPAEPSPPWSARDSEISFPAMTTSWR